MNQSLKNMLYLLLAMVVGSLVVYGIESLSHYLYPPPADMDTSNNDSIKMYMKMAPAGSLAIVLLGHALGAMVSGWLIGRFTSGSAPWLTVVAALIWTLLGLANLVMIPHPLWFTISDICIYYPMTVLGARLSGK
jgi:hypothetical protein